jgi:hypothetical protein
MISLLCNEKAVFSQSLDLHSDTIFRSYMQKRYEGEQKMMPAYEFLTLNACDLGVKGLSLKASGFGLYDFADLQGNRRLDGNLNFMFFEYRNENRKLDIKAGRHFVFAGAGYGDVIDGATLSYDLPLGFQFMAFGGFSVYQWYYSKTDETTFGGRIGHSHESILGTTDIGLSFIQKQQEGDVERENIGLDFLYSPARFLDFSGFLLYEDITGQIQDLDIAMGIRPSGYLKAVVDYNRTIPSLFIPRNSIFAVFGVDSNDSIGIDLSYRPARKVNLGAEFHYFRFNDSADTGYTAEVRGTYSLCSKYGDIIGLSFKRLTEYDNGYLDMRLFALLKPAGIFGKKLSFSAETDLFFYDREINDYSKSLNFRGSAGYSILTNLSISGSVDFSINPMMQQAFSGMIKAAYFFGKTGN